MCLTVAVLGCNDLANLDEGSLFVPCLSLIMSGD